MILETHSYLSQSYQKGHNHIDAIEGDFKGLSYTELKKIYKNETHQMIDVTEFARQLNGVDPLTIQVELEKHLGKLLSINEIIKLL
jgi:hypothetical protein